MEFGNPLGFYALTSLGILILIYLIQPRPKDVVIPSLMFIMKDTGATKQATFFKKFFSSVLFLLQFLALALLAFSLTWPMMKVMYDSTAGNTVVVLDVSASMQAQDGVSTRFDEAISIAKRSLKGKSSIVLAENRPALAVEGKSEEKAKSLLETIRAKDTRTNLGDAIVLAGDLLEGQEGRILVMSDFAWTEGADPEVVRRLLEAKDLVVDYVKVGSPAKNVGIVDLKIDRLETKIFVRNFNKKENTITLSIDYENAEDKKMSKTILAESMETFVIESKGGITMITIEDDDDLLVDNTAWVSNPQKQKIKAMLVTDTGDIFIKNALLASGNIDVTVTESTLAGTTFDENKPGYKIIVLGNADPTKLPPKFLERDIKQAVEKGAAFIVEAHEKLPQLDTGGILPVDIGQKLEETTITANVQNQFTKDVTFGSVKEYFRAIAPNATVVIATASDGSPIIAMKEFGDGKVVYYGINDVKSDFKSTPAYPIFWNNMINFLLGIEDLNNFNFKTGSMLSFDNEREIKTPTGTIKTPKIVLDKAGIYEIEGRQYAVNLLSEAESNVAQETEIQARESEGYVAKRVEREKDVSLELYLVIGAFFIIFGELLYTKFQGDV
ncbi:VWA domain-containing protein [Candidatus Woesearchaeota archaeon]|nr:VWA domain-containing protein [Candidatus Woesearchaeota archaeon]